MIYLFVLTIEPVESKINNRLEKVWQYAHLDSICW